MEVMRRPTVLIKMTGFSSVNDVQSHLYSSEVNRTQNKISCVQSNLEDCLADKAQQKGHSDIINQQKKLNKKEGETYIFAKEEKEKYVSRRKTSIFLNEKEYNRESNHNCETLSTRTAFPI